MKHLSFLKNIALTCGAIAATAAVSSCSSTTLPQLKAEQLVASTSHTVFSYNDANSPRVRLCTEAGPMPDNVRRALNMWLRKSTVKTVSYAYPQYFIAMVNPRNGRQSVWSICSDGQGNMVGILIPRDGVAAWDLPFVGNYKLYVCDTKDRKPISDAIMETLADAGYDTYRINARKASGLRAEQYLISKPLTSAEQQRIEELRRAEAEESGAETTSEEEDSSTTETATPVAEESTEPPPADVDDVTDTDSSDEGSSDDDSSDDDSSAEDDSSDDSSDEEEDDSDEEEDDSSDEEE